MSDTTSSPSSAAAQPSPVQPASRRLHGPGVVQVAIVVAILGGGILLTNLTSDVTKATEPGVRVVNGEPYLEERAGRWVGGPQGGLAPEEREVLPGDTAGARRVYADVLSNQVACTIILAGKDVTSVHRPEMCLTGQGWQMQEEHVESVSDPAVPGGKIELMRMNATRQVRRIIGSGSCGTRRTASCTTPTTAGPTSSSMRPSRPTHRRPGSDAVPTKRCR